MRLILILILSFGMLNTGWTKPNKTKSKIKIKRVVTVTKKMSEKNRKALARRQVAHARYVASLRKQHEKTPEFKANHEVIIKDYGMEATPPTESEKAVMSATITSEDLRDQFN